MLAALSDVKRVLRIALSDESHDAELLAWLETAEKYVSRRYRVPFVPVGQVTTTTAHFWHVRCDAMLPLPSENVTVTEVKIEDEVMTEDSWQLVGGNTVELQPSMTIEPFEGAEAQVPAWWYETVDITYSTEQTVDPDLRDGVALIAAGLWQQSKTQASGKSQESLGDYSYSSQLTIVVPPLAKTLLAPFKKSRLAVT